MQRACSGWREAAPVYLVAAHPSTMSTFVGANAVASAANGSGYDAALLTLIGGLLCLCSASDLWIDVVGHVHGLLPKQENVPVRSRIFCNRLHLMRGIDALNGIHRGSNVNLIFDRKCHDRDNAIPSIFIGFFV